MPLSSAARALAADPAAVDIVVLHGGEVVGVEALGNGAYSVGSSSDCDVRLIDRSIAAQHAVIYVKDGRVAVQDSASETGVLVNGARITVCELSPTDLVQLGPFQLRAIPVRRKSVRANATMPAAIEQLFRAPPPSRQTRPMNPVVREHTTRVDVALADAGPSMATNPIRGNASSNRRLRKISGGVDSKKVIVRADEVASRGGSGRSERRPSKPELNAKPSPKGDLSDGAPADAKPHLFVELYWGLVRQSAACFGPEIEDVIGDLSDKAQVPLWGFSVPSGGMVLAEAWTDSFRMRVPPKAQVEIRKGEHFYPVPREQLEKDAGGRYVHLKKGGAVRFSEGQMSLVAQVALPPKRVPSRSVKELPRLPLALTGAFGAVFLALVALAPDEIDHSDFDKRELAPAAVKLIMPEEKKPEPPPEEKKVEEKEPKNEEKPEVAEKVEKTPRRKTEKVVVQKEKGAKTNPAPETKALKALQKISAAGPAMGDLLAAVDKLGNGPGSKDAKTSDYRLSGLIGKAPIANAGLGTFGLGGGGKGGGFGTVGAESRRGKGGGGIGACGAGGYGRSGRVGGTVTRGSARNVAVRGTIDREAVARVVNAHLQEVRACYERELLQNPNLAGKVVLEWVINTSGVVASAKTKSSSLRSGAVEGCILSSLKTWRFPPARGGVVIVSYPFMFNSVGY